MFGMQPTPITVPMEPIWPFAEDRIRIEQSRTRLALLREDWEKDLAEFLRTIWGEEKRAAVGIVDTGWNALASFCAQMSRPGLYGAEPTLHMPAEARPLERLLQRALWSTQQQHVEYLTRGLGDMFLRPHVTAEGRPSLRQVHPHRVYVISSIDDPDRLAMLKELRLRYSKATGWMWTWEVYDILDPENPEYRIEAASGGGEVRDWTNVFAPAVEGYPWRYRSGEPFIPYVHYRSDATGEFWAWSSNRGLHRATFHAARLSNTTLYGADAAAMPIVLLMNAMVAEGVSVQAARAGGEVRTVSALPGSLIPCMPLDADKPMQAIPVSGSADVLALFQVQRAYTLSVLAQRGLRGEDVSRNEGNPTSAAALSISDTSRREEQRRLRPLFAASDAELCQQLAAMCRIQGVADLDELPDEEGAYVVEHHEIPMSAGELEAERADLEYQRSRGLLSDVDIYLRRHPGVPRDVAIRAIQAARAEQAALDAAVKRASTDQERRDNGASDEDLQAA